MLNEQYKVKLIDSFNKIKMILNDDSLTKQDMFTEIDKINDEIRIEFIDDKIICQRVYYYYIVKHMLNSDIEHFENIAVTLDLDTAIRAYLSGSNRRIEIWFSDQKISEFWGEDMKFDDIKELILDSFI